MEHFNWGIPVAVDLFLAALGAGAFMLAVLADLTGKKRYRLISAVGAFIAPWPVIGGVLLLVIDLGRPWLFWEMLLKRGEGLTLEYPFLQFRLGSTMSIGTWVLTIFVWVSFAYIAATVAAYPFKWVGILRKLIGIIGLPIAIMVTVYTGVLLSASPNPLWNSMWLPVTFVFSAMATATASVIFVIAALKLFGVVGEHNADVPKLERMNSTVIFVQLLAVIVFMLASLGVPQMKLVIGAGFGALWWVGIIFLGLVVPFLYGRKGEVKSPQTSLVMAALVLLGGFFLRYVILIAGQMA